MVYSRYADDITISFPHFSTKEVLIEKMEKYRNDLNPFIKEQVPTSEEIKETMKRFEEDTFIVTDNFEFKFLQQQINNMKVDLDRRSIG